MGNIAEASVVAVAMFILIFGFGVIGMITAKLNQSPIKEGLRGNFPHSKGNCSAKDLKEFSERVYISRRDSHWAASGYNDIAYYLRCENCGVSRELTKDKNESS